MGCHALLQGIFPTQGSNLDLLHCKQILYGLNHQESQVLSLDWEVILKKEMATHSSILACRIPWTEEPGGL